jgi:hypothetical protein
MARFVPTVAINMVSFLCGKCQLKGSDILHNKNNERGKESQSRLETFKLSLGQFFYLETRHFGQIHTEDLPDDISFVISRFVTFADADFGKSFPYLKLELIYPFF